MPFRPRMGSGSLSPWDRKGHEPPSLERQAVGQQGRLGRGSLESPGSDRTARKGGRPSAWRCQGPLGHRGWARWRGPHPGCPRATTLLCPGHGVTPPPSPPALFHPSLHAARPRTSLTTRQLLESKSSCCPLPWGPAPGHTCSALAWDPPQAAALLALPQLLPLPSSLKSLTGLPVARKGLGCLDRGSGRGPRVSGPGQPPTVARTVLQWVREEAPAPQTPAPPQQPQAVTLL